VNNLIVFSFILNIGATLAISIVLIRKNYYVRPLSIFIALYIIGQIAGYGLDIDILKAVIPSYSQPESGIEYQVIPSTAFPLVLAFVSNYVYKFFEK